MPIFGPSSEAVCKLIVKGFGMRKTDGNGSRLLKTGS